MGGLLPPFTPAGPSWPGRAVFCAKPGLQPGSPAVGAMAPAGFFLRGLLPRHANSRRTRCSPFGSCGFCRFMRLAANPLGHLRRWISRCNSVGFQVGPFAPELRPHRGPRPAQRVLEMVVPPHQGVLNDHLLHGRPRVRRRIGCRPFGFGVVHSCPKPCPLSNARAPSSTASSTLAVSISTSPSFTSTTSQSS